jgi:hypothetical protein
MMTHLPAGRRQNRRQSNTTSRRSRWRVTVTAQRQSDVVTLPVTRSDAATVTPQQEFTRSDFEKAIGEEEADGLRLVIVLSACGAFVAALRDRSQIALTHVNR